ncbi:MAG: 4Fe-4S binding protein [Desulfobacteraceae bacterium]|nr:4Fe-4S binding protein [Desulfobacteraceae bacterium]
MTDIYKKLALHLNKTPGGFPETASGVELRILKQLFTDEEAELACSLHMVPEQVKDMAKRLGRDEEKLEKLLKTMLKKGLVLYASRNGLETYMQAQFVIGIWEYQVDLLTEQLIKDFNEYVPYLTDEMYKHKTQQLRVIPVGASINAEIKIMDYEEAEKIIKSQSKIIVAPCICRKEHAMLGKGCDKPVETCLVFAGGAYYYEERSIGRSISQDEAIEILHNAVDNGLVLQPGNSKRPQNICMCCSCCCQILKNLNNNEQPAKIINSSYFAEVDEELCTACEACEEVCPMDAITVEETAFVNTDRCIGCGLCITRCEFDSMTLKPKKDSEKWVPPENIIGTYNEISKEKGLL